MPRAPASNSSSKIYGLFPVVSDTLVSKISEVDTFNRRWLGSDFKFKAKDCHGKMGVKHLLLIGIMC